jgi:thiol-disulfide isomerase/thioredoxin
MSVRRTSPPPASNGCEGTLGLIPSRLLLAILLVAGPAHAGAAQPKESPAAELLDLEQWQGRVVLVDFWASWCVPCRRSFPWMQSMLDKHGASGLVVVAVDVGESREAADAFTRQFQNEFHYLYDAEGRIADALGVDAMPTSILFDRQGRPVFRHAGFRSQDTTAYEGQIVSLLQANAQAAPPALEIRPARRSGLRPWERGVLARESMRLDAGLLSLAFDDHMYFSKEASSGGRSFGGGGCGCN